MLKRAISIVMILTFCATQAGPAYALRPRDGAHSKATGSLEAALANAGTTGAATGFEQCSSILLDRKNPPPQPVDIASFTVIDSKPEKAEDGKLFKIDNDGLIALQAEDFDSFTAMIKEMCAILINAQPESQADIEEMQASQVVQRFNKFASLKMQNFILKMAIEYNLDMHTEVILQWGAPKLARYHLVRLPNVPDRRRHVLNIDIAAFFDNNLLEAEVLHEILHPRINPWLNKMHLDLPELIKAVPEATVSYPDTNPGPGFYAQEAPVDRPEAFKELAAALAELFVLLREWGYIDNKGATLTVAEKLRNPDNPLDRGSRAADMLEKKGKERIEAILDFMSDESNPAYKGPSENTKRIPKGTRLLKGIDSGLLGKILERLHGRLDACLCEPMDVLPETLDEVAQLIQAKGVQEIELYLVDEEGHLMGENEQSVLLLVNESTPGILSGGISVDLSSLTSSITGQSLSPITDSDGIAQPDPATFRILIVSVGGRRRAIMSAQVKKPLEVEPASLEGKYDFGGRYRFVDIDRSYSEDRARKAVKASIKRAAQLKSRKLGRKASIENVKVFLSDFSGNTHIIEVPVSQLDAYFEQGILLTDEQKKYFPTTADKSGLVVKIDPYSLRIVDYADDDEEIEALMLCSIEDADGNPFEGDYRAKLAETAKRQKEIGRTVVVSAEPEIYFSRESPDGRLFSSDNSGYYSMISNLPLDVQAAFDYLIRAMETAGITARYIHPEVGPGQFEVPIEHQDLLKFGDSLVFYKYLVQKSASKAKLVASFLPKPIEGKAGSGQHVHVSVFEGKTNLFWKKDAKLNLSDFAHRFIAGLIDYSYSILTLIGPARSAYERLVPGFEAPCDGAVTNKGRSGEVRVPASNSPVSTRVEFRPPNPLGNPYAQLLAVVEAGLRGVEKNLPPKRIYEENLYKMPPAQKIKEGIEQLPGRNDFLGIDGPMALKHAQALMLVDPNHPFVEEVKSRMSEASYEKLTQKQKGRFKKMYGIEGVDEATAALTFNGMKVQAIKSFLDAVDPVNNERARDRKEFIESLLTEGEIAYLASPEEADTGFMEKNNLLGPAIVSQAAPLPTAAGAAGKAREEFEEALKASLFAGEDAYVSEDNNACHILSPELVAKHGAGLGILLSRIKGLPVILLVNTRRERQKLVEQAGVSKDMIIAFDEHERDLNLTIEAAVTKLRQTRNFEKPVPNNPNLPATVIRYYHPEGTPNLSGAGYTNLPLTVTFREVTLSQRMLNRRPLRLLEELQGHMKVQGLGKIALNHTNEYIAYKKACDLASALFPEAKASAAGKFDEAFAGSNWSTAYVPAETAVGHMLSIDLTAKTGLTMLAKIKCGEQKMPVGFLVRTADERDRLVRELGIDINFVGVCKSDEDEVEAIEQLAYNVVQYIVSLNGHTNSVTVTFHYAEGETDLVKIASFENMPYGVMVKFHGTVITNEQLEQMRDNIFEYAVGMGVIFSEPMEDREKDVYDRAVEINV